jgi:LCP family protein required for cell wall assembly
MRLSPVSFIIGVVALATATIVCSAVGFTTARSIASEFRSGVEAVSFQDFLREQPTLTPVPTQIAQVLPTLASDVTLAPTEVLPTPTFDPLADIPPITDPRRFTLLLMGIDQRAGEVGPFRTDTLILMSVDPVRKTAGVLSIPRDLWVTIPGFQSGRINTANSLGDANGYPGGGPALAAATVELNLGIPVDNYVLINFDVFTQVVQVLAPNGVEVCPPALIEDNGYPDGSYGVISIRFEAGCQRLEAERLLQYARTRHGNSDFERSRRQQEVLAAFRNEVLNAGGLVNVIGQLPTLWSDVSGNVQTNLTFEQMLSLAQLAQEIPEANIQFGVMDNLYVDLAQTNTGDQVLIPRQAAVNFLLQQVFNPQGDVDIAELRARAEAENASIVVYNNTDIQGLAGQTRDWLTSQGIDVSAVGNLQPITNTTTLIRDYTGKIWTARYLAALLGLSPDQVQPGADGATTGDVMVVVGSDIQTLLTGR